jgi:hypothetical protein
MTNQSRLLGSFMIIVVIDFEQLGEQFTGGIRFDADIESELEVWFHGGSFRQWFGERYVRAKIR